MNMVITIHYDSTIGVDKKQKVSEKLGEKSYQGLSSLGFGKYFVIFRENRCKEFECGKLTNLMV